MILATISTFHSRALADPPNFEEQVKPVFREACAGCHNAGGARGGLDLTSYSALMRGGSSGDIVVPGDPDASTLFQLLTHQREPHMPPNAPRRTEAELDVIRQWIAGGLIERKGGSAQAATKSGINLVAAPAMRRPAGPPIMPQGLPLQPISTPIRPGPVIAMAASPWAPLVALGGSGQISLHHMDNLELLGVLPFPDGEPHVLKFSQTGKLLICGGGTGARVGNVVVWDVASGKRLATVGDETDVVLAADISPDQGSIALGGPPRLVRIYASDDGRTIRDIKKHTDWVTAIEYSPDGVLLATGDRGGGLILWEAESGQEFQVLQGHQGAITDIGWRGDGNVLASASEDGTIRLWNPADGKQVKQWSAHDGGTLAIDYAHDGNIASCGRDKRLKIWDGTGKQLRTIEGFPDIALSVAMSHDGKRALAGDWSGGVAVVDTGTGQRLGALLADPPTLAQSIEKATAAMAASTRKIAEAEQRVRDGEATLKGQQAAVNAIRQRAAAIEKQLKEADAKVAALAKTDAEGRTVLNRLMGDLAEKRQQIDAVAERRKKEAAALASMTASLSSMDAAIAELKKKTEVLAAASASTAAEPGAVPADPARTTAAADLDKKLKTSAELRASIEKAKVALGAMDARIAKLGAEVAALRPIIAEKGKVATASAARLTEANNSRKAIVIARDGAAKEVAAESGKESAAGEKVGALKSSLAEARSEYDALEARLARAREAQLDEILRVTSQRIAPNAKEPPPISDLVSAVKIGVEKIRPSDLRPDTNTVGSAAAGGGSGEDIGDRVPFAQPPWFFLGRFHLILLHLPIGILMAAFLFEMDYLWRRKPWCGRFAGQLLLLGAAMAALTAIAGLLLSLEPGYAPGDIATHKWLGIAAAAGAIGAALTRHLAALWGRAIYWGLFAQMMLCTVLAGHAGGELTHGEGYLVRYFPDWLASSTASKAVIATSDGSEFQDSIQPILEANCQSCHGSQRQSGGLRLDNRDSAISGGKSGFAAIVPGRALESELVRRVLLSRGHGEVMPPTSKPAMRDEDVIRLIRWINEGAPWPKQNPATVQISQGATERQ